METKISATIVADSVNEFGNRITTMVVTFPRYILAELNTHRMFSRNSASSRAIPFEKMLKSVTENPYIPMAWQKDHKGMQGTQYFTEEEVAYGEFVAQYLAARDAAVEAAIGLSEGITYSDGIDSGDAPSNETSVGVTKQIINRLLEPFIWHTVIVTATEWENFFALRCPKYVVGDITTAGVEKKEYRSRKNVLKDFPHFEEQISEIWWLKMNTGQADIHMMALAEAMWDAYKAGAPKILSAGHWHIPFGDKIDLRKLANLIPHHQNEDGTIQDNPELIEGRIKVATARCARVSYTVFGEEDKPDNYENDIKLHDRLAASGHWSPFEHIARAMTSKEYMHHLQGPFTVESRFIEFSGQPGGRTETQIEGSKGWSGNLRGFIQYRKTFQNENYDQAPYA